MQDIYTSQNQDCQVKNVNTLPVLSNSLATQECDQRGNKLEQAGFNNACFPINSTPVYEFYHEFIARKKHERQELSRYIYKAGYKDELSQAYGKFIQELGERLDFSWFATLTFRYPIHPESADKTFRLWVHKINRKIYGVRYYKRKGQGIRWIRALERQKRSVIHFHCLIADIPETWDKTTKDFRRLHWLDEWFKIGGIARIVAYDKRLGACFYLGKYVSKDGEIDYSDNIANSMNKQLPL